MFTNHDNQHFSYGTDCYDGLTLRAWIIGREVNWSLHCNPDNADRCGECELIEEGTSMLDEYEAVYNQHLVGVALAECVGNEIINQMFGIWGMIMRAIERKERRGRIAEWLRDCGEVSSFLPHTSGIMVCE